MCFSLPDILVSINKIHLEAKLTVTVIVINGTPRTRVFRIIYRKRVTREKSNDEVHSYADVRIESCMLIRYPHMSVNISKLKSGGDLVLTSSCVTDRSPLETMNT